MIDKLKELLGEKRLAKLAKVPFVAERGGIEAHLQAACKDVAHVGVALQNAINGAGLVLTPKEVEAFTAALAEYDATKANAAMVVKADGKPKKAKEKEQSAASE